MAKVMVVLKNGKLLNDCTMEGTAHRYQENMENLYLEFQKYLKDNEYLRYKDSLYPTNAIEYFYISN